jgi:flagellar protein FliL
MFLPGNICRLGNKSKAFINHKRRSFWLTKVESMAKKKSDDDAPEDGEGGGKRKLKLKLPGNKLMIIGAAVSLLAFGGGGFWFYKKNKGEPEQMASQQGDQKASASAPAQTGPKKPSAFLDLPEMTVNLAAGSGQQDRQQFLRMKIALEVGEQKVATEIQTMLPRVMDTFQVFMRELRPQDLEGSSGLYRLKEEMTRRVNVAVYPARVDAILFKELMVQ